MLAYISYIGLSYFMYLRTPLVFEILEPVEKNSTVLIQSIMGSKFKLDRTLEIV